MDWSIDSEMLALVVAQSPDINTTAASRSPQQHWVQVWRRSNWHWYLKQEARHDAEEVNDQTLRSADCHDKLQYAVNST
jgi:IKI3 family